MARLIIHVGPGKCGSSSIQDFFATQDKPCKENVAYSFIRATPIYNLEHNTDVSSAINYFQKILSALLVKDNCVILSQEFLFQTPSVVNKICQLAEEATTDISIIGYCRQQSSFLVSQYSQWLFRAVNRNGEINKHINHMSLDWRLFSGLERQIIASIYNNFQSSRMLGGYSIDNWNESYQNLETHISNKNIKILCGVLPNRNSKKTLIEDFCEKANLTLLPKAKNNGEQISNPSFSSDIVESINNAILHNYDMPAPHNDNNLIQLLSSSLSNEKGNDSSFMTLLKTYIDGYYRESNQLHCKRYNLDQTYFANPKKIKRSEILQIIKQEGERRKQNPMEAVDNYRELNAKLMQLCIKLIKR